MIKHRQHYVWKNYLKAWAFNNQIFCLRNNGIFNTSLDNIANQRDFYVINDLTNDDIINVKQLFIENIKNEFMRDINENWIKLFDFVINFRNKVNKEEMTKEMKEDFENKIMNFEEELQSKYEEMGMPYIEMLRNGDTRFYYDEDSNILFNLYLSMQYFRTKKIQSTVINEKSKYSLLKVDRIWKLMAQIFATNLAASLYLERNELHPVLLINTTNNPFITADQPLINTKANYKEKQSEPPDKYESYYPISPILALLITKEPEYYSIQAMDIQGQDVLKYNQLINDASEEQVYGSSEEVLKKYIIYS